MAQDSRSIVNESDELGLGLRFPVCKIRTKKRICLPALVCISLCESQTSFAFDFGLWLKQLVFFDESAKGGRGDFFASQESFFDSGTVNVCLGVGLASKLR